MDKQYSVKFFTSFVEAMQKLCREYLDFDQGVELSGYLAVEIDNFKKERYVLSEMLQSNGSVISESYCTKAFKTLRKEMPKYTSSHGNENTAPRDHESRTGRSHSEEVTIVLRESPETVLHHSNYPSHTTPRKQISTHNQRHNFHSSQRTHASSSQLRETSSLANDPLDSSTSSRQHQHEEGQPLQIMPRPLEAEIKDSWNASSESSSPHATVGSPSSMTPRSPANIGQKRPYQNLDSSHVTTIKKDKVDESLQSLFDAAREIAEVSQADIDSMKNNYPGISSATSTSNTASSTSTAITAKSASLDESIRLPIPVEVKLEKEDIPYMVIDNPSDTEVKTFPGDTAYNSDQTSAAYSGDQSMTQSTYGDSVNTSDSPGGASWDMGQQGIILKKARGKPINSHIGQLKRAFVCDICSQRFSLPNNLSRHKKSLHQKVVKHTCSICGSMFNRKDNLHAHMRLHALSKTLH